MPDPRDALHSYREPGGNWKGQVRRAQGGHKLEVAFDAIGGKAIDDLAEVVDVGGTIINFGSLGRNMGTNIYSLTMLRSERVDYELISSVAG